MSVKDIQITLEIVKFFCTLGIFLGLYFATTNHLDKIFVITRISHNWENSPFSKIEPSSDICPENSVISYNFPGTYEGCDCREIPRYSVNYHEYSGRIFQGYCDQNQTKATCKDIPPQPEIEINKWKNSNFCFSKQKFDYYNLTIVSANQQCPLYHQKCGIIDTLGNYLCVRLQDDCPVNFLKIYRDEDKLYVDTQNVNFGGEILSEFKVSDSEPCLNRKQNKFTEQNYILFKKSKHSQGCLDYIEKNNNKIVNDNRYKLIDHYQKYKFYEQSEVAKKLKNLPNFPDLNDVSIKLFGSTYIGWNKNCTRVNSSEFKDLKTQLNLIQFNHGYLIKIVTYTIIFLFVFIYYFNFQNYEIKVEYLYIKSNFVINTILIYIGFVIFNSYIIHLINKNITIKMTNQKTNIFELIFNGFCSDEITNLSFLNFRSLLLENLERYNYIKIFCYINIFTSIVSLFLGFISNKYNFSYVIVSDENRKRV